MQEFRKILIVKPSSLGDIVHSLPVLDSLKRRFPDSTIHWVVARGFEGILEGHPMIERLWIIDKDDWKKLSRAMVSVSELRNLFRSLRSERFDCVIDLQGLLRSGIITGATGAPLRIGFREAREGSRLFYTHTVEGGKDVHAVDRYLKIARFLGCDTGEVFFPFPGCGTAFTDLALPSGIACGRYAVLVPGARWASKRWPAEKFGRLAARLPVKSVVVGGKGDATLAGDVVRFSKGTAFSLAGKTDLKGLVEVVRCARFMVCNDSGPMHIAAAMGIHVFALLGPTNPLRTGPYGEKHTIIRKDIPCSPCYRRSCKNNECMAMIKVEEVGRLIDDFLIGR